LSVHVWHEESVLKCFGSALAAALGVLVAPSPALGDEQVVPRVGQAISYSAELSVDAGEGRASGGTVRAVASFSGFGLTVGLAGRRLLESRVSSEMAPEADTVVSSRFAGSASLGLRLSPLAWLASRAPGIVDLYGEAGLEGGAAFNGTLVGSLPLSVGLDLRWPRAIRGYWPQLSARYTHHAAREPTFMLADEVTVGLGVAVGSGSLFTPRPWH
jgi:hypothetical protein